MNASASDTPYLQRDELLVGTELVTMLESEALPAAGVDPARFWSGHLSAGYQLSTPGNKAQNTKFKIVVTE